MSQKFPSPLNTKDVLIFIHDKKKNDIQVILNFEIHVLKCMFRGKSKDFKLIVINHLTDLNCKFMCNAKGSTELKYIGMNWGNIGEVRIHAITWISLSIS